MKVILHIGPHKTGTTAIQTFLTANAGTLARHGIRYPRPIDGTHNHHAVAHGLRQPSLRAQTADWIRAMLDESESMGCRTCVLSSEMFAEHGIPIEALDECMPGHELSVLAYVRRPDHMWASAYSQLVIEPEARRTARIVDEPLPYDCGYSTVFLKWMSLLSPGRLVLAPFDRAQWPEGSLLRDFLAMAGAPDPLFAECDASANDPNASLPAVLVEAIRVANASGRFSAKEHGELVERARRLAKRFPRMLRRPPRLPRGAPVRRAFDMLDPWLHAYRPYYRPGFDDSFLRIAGHGHGAAA
ncbi:MAG: hypothetical protein FGM39_02595 [Phycisphaerales bacterium]|nr:hypothetical protein [Phycisphaerales bacterium]